MTHAVDADLVVQGLGSFLYIVLGVWVLTLTPRRRQTTLLGAFAILFGLGFATVNTLRFLDLFPGVGTLVHWIVQHPSLGLSQALAFLLAWRVVEPPEDRSVPVSSLVGGFALALATSAADITSAASGGLDALFWLTDFFFVGLLLSASTLLAIRAHPSHHPSTQDLRQIGLLGVAFGLLSAFVSGMFVPQAAQVLAEGDVIEFFSLAPWIAAWLFLAGLWLRNMIAADGEHVHIHRSVALAILAILAAGAVYQVAFPAIEANNNIMRGVVRTLGVGLLAYGVLRHDLAGLDAKVEWGLSKSTVAGIFVAVFFIVSEGAQALFADFAGNEFLGVLAAGALVFAISPLQRLADRFAAKAVPGGAQAGHAVEDRYRDVVETALADGEITEGEERHLAEKAEELGLSPTRAYELRREVEDRGQGGGD